MGKGPYHQERRPKVNSGTYTVEGENRLLQVGLWPLHGYHDMQVNTCNLIQLLEAGEEAQLVRVSTTLTKDPSLVTSTHVRWLTPSVAPAPGELTLASSLLGHCTRMDTDPILRMHDFKSKNR